MIRKKCVWLPPKSIGFLHCFLLMDLYGPVWPLAMGGYLRYLPFYHVYCNTQAKPGSWNKLLWNSSCNILVHINEWSANDTFFEVIWVYHTMGNSLKSCNFNFDHTAVVVSHISSPNIFFCKVGFYYIIDGLVSWRHRRKKCDEGRGCLRCFGLQWAQHNCSPPNRILD